MSDDVPFPSRASPLTTRRGLLALVGSVALTGCTTLSVGDEPDIELDGEALRALPNDNGRAPQTIPIEIQPAYLDDAERRARELLESVPQIGREEIPNGVIRARVTDAREAAEDVLERATNSTSPYQRLLELERARTEARFVAATWAALDAGRTREDVVSAASALTQSVSEFRERWQYVGDDPVRSVVVHEVLEGRLRGATSLVERLPETRTYAPGEVLDVGALAEDAERIRSTVTDAGHLYDQYTTSLDERETMRTTFERARETLVTNVREQTRERFGTGEEYPEPSSLVEPDISGTPAATVVSLLVRDLMFVEWNHDESDWWLANDLTRAHEQLARHRALDGVLAHIEREGPYTIERVAEVETIRSEAVDAVSAALSGPDVSLLTRRLVPDVARRIEFADERLAGLDGETVHAGRLDNPIATYILVTFIAEATPFTSGRVETVIRSV